MKIRDRIIAALTWNEIDYVPWAVKPNHLPRGYWERELRNKGLGLTLEVRVFKITMPNVTYEHKFIGDLIIKTYITPLGSLSEKIRRGLPSEAGERSDQWRVESLIKAPDDYKVLEFMIEDMKIRPNYNDFIIIDKELGPDGITYTSIGYTPLMEIIVNYMGFRTFALEIKKRPEKVEELIEHLHEKKLEICRIVAKSPAKFVLLGDNIDEVLVDPRFFKRYCIPYYQEYVEILHKSGKIVGSHMDGRLKKLKELILETGLDFIHGFTPPPYGNLSIKEARECWKENIALWVNIPETVFYYEPVHIEEFIKCLLKEGAPGNGLMLGITETVPPTRRRIGYESITNAVLKYGKYPIRIC